MNVRKMKVGDIEQFYEKNNFIHCEHVIFMAKEV